MAPRRETATPADPSSYQGAEPSRALAHWMAQEQAPLPDDDFADFLDDRRLPSGWWMLPAAVMALPIWGFLIWMVMRA